MKNKDNTPSLHHTDFTNFRSDITDTYNMTTRGSITINASESFKSRSFGQSDNTVNANNISLIIVNMFSRKTSPFAQITAKQNYF